MTLESGGTIELGEEGVVQIFWPRFGAREPVLGAVGELQLEVFQTRLEVEYGVSLRLERKGWTRARWVKDVTDEEVAETVRILHEKKLDEPKGVVVAPPPAATTERLPVTT